MRPADAFLLEARIIAQLRSGRFESIEADCNRLEQLGHRTYVALIALYRGELDAFERIRSVDGGEDPYHQTLLLGLAPPNEEQTARLVRSAAELEKVSPLDKWRRRWIGLAQLRAGQPDKAKETLAASLGPDSGSHFDCVVWPLLAMACEQLGERSEAERWLRKSEVAQEMLARLPVTELPRALYLHDWLMSAQFHREAQALLEPLSAQTSPLPAPDN